MSWDGFIPDWVDVKCKRCGNELEKKDSGWPSRAVGIFNGLCYKCTNEGPYMAKRYADGVQWWSHPPSCPSYRRYREHYWYYPDCKNTFCKHGSVYVSRELGFGGPYYEQCKECSNRYYGHPTRAYFEKTLSSIGRIVYKVLERKEKAIRKNKKLSAEEKGAKIAEFRAELRKRKDIILNNLNDYKLTNYPKEVR